jgi:hypothetical protein
MIKWYREGQFPIDKLVKYFNVGLDLLLRFCKGSG